MRLTHLSMVDLRAVIAKDPAWRVAAWNELRFRNQAKAAFNHENGVGSEVKRWTPPTFLPPGG